MRNRTLEPATPYSIILEAKSQKHPKIFSQPKSSAKGYSTFNFESTKKNLYLSSINGRMIYVRQDSTHFIDFLFPSSLDFFSLRFIFTLHGRFHHTLSLDLLEIEGKKLRYWLSTIAWAIRSLRTFYKRTTRDRQWTNFRFGSLRHIFYWSEVRLNVRNSDGRQWEIYGENSLLTLWPAFDDVKYSRSGEHESRVCLSKSFFPRLHFIFVSH